MSMVSNLLPPSPRVQVPYSGAERRSRDPLDLLSRQYDEVCVQAVDPLQIAAALEADGINDAWAVAYGRANVFEVAEELFQRVPLRFGDRSAPVRRRQRSWRELSHGLLFALPGVFYPVAAALTDAAAATISLTFAVVVGWAWSQVMVRHAYLLIGRGMPSEAKQLLRALGLAGLMLVTLAALTAFWTLGGATLLAIGLMAYQMAAGILILERREGWLFVAMAPAVLAGSAFMMAPGVVAADWAAGIIAASLALALGLTALATRSSRVRLAPMLGVTRADLANAAPFLLYGLLCALFVSFDTLRFWTWIGPTGLGLSIAPLVLSMGALEWQLRRYRERVGSLLGHANDQRTLSALVWNEFLRSLASYAAIVTGLSLVLFSVHGLMAIDVERLALLLVANAVLGCAFFIGFALISQNRIGMVIVFLLVALGTRVFDSGVVGFALGPSGYDYSVSYLFSCTVFAVLQLTVTKTVLGQIQNYRYEVQNSGYGHAN